MTDDTQDIVARLRRIEGLLDEHHREYNGAPVLAFGVHALRDGAAYIEKQAAKIERLGRELNRAKYGDPDFSWEAHQAALDAAQAEIERLHLLLAEKALDEMERDQ